MLTFLAALLIALHDRIGRLETRALEVSFFADLHDRIGRLENATLNG
ncbi:hypothetical protein SAMN02745664_102192 [Moraxella cuniculi DSM 21768]|uniref:Uncharacterized protein n=1 Tax=Moraxella cuniculi DSM 21768 TaxID=1122245 RepID=A0A1N7DWZ3_9GAMM|nr:hypothetical protein SAMN02745664_102192 [Moraxella cuniculi DSM 21768]